MQYIKKGTKVQLHLPNTYLHQALGTIYDQEIGGYMVQMNRKFQASDGTIFVNKGDLVFVRRWEFNLVS